MLSWPDDDIATSDSFHQLVTTHVHRPASTCLLSGRRASCGVSIVKLACVANAGPPATKKNKRSWSYRPARAPALCAFVVLVSCHASAHRDAQINTRMRQVRAACASARRFSSAAPIATAGSAAATPPGWSNVPPGPPTFVSKLMVRAPASAVATLHSRRDVMALLSPPLLSVEVIVILTPPFFDLTPQKIILNLTNII